MGKKIGIVGAGVGGLATAARLARKGHQVKVYEKLPKCGGRNNLLADGGFKFDMGPSFVMMPDFFEEVFSYCGEDIKKYLDLKIIDPSYKIFFSDGDSLTVYRDSQRTKQELERIEPGSAKGFDAFIKETTRIYELVRPLLYGCFTKKDLLKPSLWPLVYKIRALESYWNLAKKFFKNEKICYAFTFEAMFMGVSPFNAPAFYSVISYTDHVQKIAHAMGGMYQIPLALEKMAKKFGAIFQYGAEVQQIKKTNNGIELKAGRSKETFENVVVNADFAYAQRDILQRMLPNYKYSCSVLLFYWGLKRKVSGLAHHNLFFSGDLKKNLDQIFVQKVVPEDPSFYIHVPTFTDGSLAPEGKDLFYVLIPVPNLNNAKEKAAEQEQRLKKIVIEKVNRLLGLNLEGLIELEHKFYPHNFLDQYNIKFGATFGLAHNLMQSAFFRPPNIDRKIKGLYYVGASTQPGGGLPVVIASSRIAADLIDDAIGS
ncbi:MAG: phytoene desaturase [Candidatus Omnitrophica bacterium]|nr:phytoene desaturase [Candidatus Omnitrophota bacterium]